MDSRNDPFEDLSVDVAALRQRLVDRHEIRCPLPQEWLARALRRTDASVSAAGWTRLELGLDGAGGVLVRGQLHAGFTVPCARCLAPAEVNASTDLCVSFVQGADPRTSGSDGNAPLDPEDLERWVYDGKQLDLRPMLAEQVAVAYPMRALCSRKEACRGLCTGCGADLNPQPEGPTCAECGVARPGQPATSGEPPAWKAALSQLARNHEDEA